MIELKENIVSKNGKHLLTVDEAPQISTWGIYDQTVIESPVFLGRSQIETEKIGGFTYINLHAVHHETTNCCIECQSIGRFCMIAHSVHIGFPSHPAGFISANLLFRYDKRSGFMHDFVTLDGSAAEKAMHDAYMEKIRKPLAVIGNDVWIGYGVTIMNGVNVGDGAVIAAGSVVSKDVEPYSIVGGNPAKIIRHRFDEKTVETLMKLRWWDYGPDIMHGIDLSDVESGVDELSQRVASGKYESFVSPKVIINNRSKTVTIEE